MFTHKCIYMRISVKNLGIIQESTIELNGLTVLTGYNDVGKSSITKLLFGIVKTIKEAYPLKQYQLNSKINTLLKDIHKAHRTCVNLDLNRNIDFNPIFLPEKDDNLPDNPDVASYEKYFSKYLSEVKKNINLYFKPTEKRPTSELLFQEIENNKQSIECFIKQKIELHSNKFIHSVYQFYFEDVVVNGIFENQFVSFESDVCTVEIWEGATQLINIEVKKNEVISFNYFNKLFINDLSIIETPLILAFERNRFSKPISFTLSPSEDLLNKVKSNINPSPLPPPEMISLSNKIQEIIKGDLRIESDMLIFKRENYPIRIQNVATGIKSFGIIQILIRNGTINPGSILVIDEPEVHLHPAWEVKYAEVILELVKNGILVIVSTHSSFILSALDRFSKDQNIKDKIHYYYGEKSEKTNLSNFTEFNLNESPIWKTISKPMRDLM